MSSVFELKNHWKTAYLGTSSVFKLKTQHCSYLNKQFRNLQNHLFRYEQFSVRTVFYLKWHFFTFAGCLLTQLLFLAVQTPFGKNINWFLYSFYLYFGVNKFNSERRLKFSVLCFFQYGHPDLDSGLPGSPVARAQGKETTEKPLI